MLIKPLLRLKEQGDTLIEVLIAIAVLSLILGGAYVTTNRSLRATRDTQERGVALKLLEGQLEQLKGLITTNPTVGTTGNFCIYSGTAVTSSSSSCKVDSNGAPTTTEPMYKISISRSAADDTFTATNTWVSVTGNGNAQEQLVYRVHP